MFPKLMSGDLRFQFGGNKKKKAPVGISEVSLKVPHGTNITIHKPSQGSSTASSTGEPAPTPYPPPAYTSNTPLPRQLVTSTGGPQREVFERSTMPHRNSSRQSHFEQVPAQISPQFYSAPLNERPPRPISPTSETEVESGKLVYSRNPSTSPPTQYQIGSFSSYQDTPNTGIELFSRFEINGLKVPLPPKPEERSLLQAFMNRRTQQEAPSTSFELSSSPTHRKKAPSSGHEEDGEVSSSEYEEEVLSNSQKVRIIDPYDFTSSKYPTLPEFTEDMSLPDMYRITIQRLKDVLPARADKMVAYKLLGNATRDNSPTRWVDYENEVPKNMGKLRKDCQQYYRDQLEDEATKWAAVEYAKLHPDDSYLPIRE